ncbi:MAG: extracellular solute-binding protein [Anaerolineales bacterium]|nr:extracellular solute-binding protein [Anaerolineales bacterium]
MRQRSAIQLILSLVILIGLLAGCSGDASSTGNGSNANGGAAAAPEKTIAVSGAFALFPLMSVWAEEYQKLHPNIQFDIQAGGAGKGMTDVLAGAVDIAMLSREARQEELDQGSVLVPVTIDSVIGTVNAKNPNLEAILKHGITGESGAGAWISGDTKTWGQLLGTDSTDSVNPYTRSDASGAAEMWAKFLGAKAQEELKGTAVNGDPGVAEAVRQDPLSIGFNNVGFAYDPATGKPIDGLAIVPIDINGDGQVTADENFYGTRDEFTAAVAAGKYPFPPARVLYLVTKGAPSPEIVDFYRWVLTDGQQIVQPAGYVQLTEERIADALAGLKK